MSRLVTIKRALSKGEQVLDRVSGVFMSMGGVVLVVWVFIFTGTIIARAFFHATPAYLEEYTEYWTVFITCVALAYTLRTGGHIRVSIVVAHLPQRARDAMEVFVALIALITSCVLTAQGSQLLLFAIRENICNVSGTQSLLWPSMLWIPVGFGFLSLALLIYLCHAILAVARRTR